MQQNISAADEIYGYRSGYLFYLDRKYLVSGAHFGEQMEQWFQQGIEHAAQQLKKHEVKFVLTQQKAEGYMDTNEKTAWLAFREKYLTLVHEEGDAILYQFHSSISQKQ
ncbi:MAG: hypothetical protein ACOX5R_07955 [bacterium]